MKQHTAECRAATASIDPAHVEAYCRCPDAEEEITATLTFNGKACEPFIVAPPDFREVDEPEPAPVEQLGIYCPINIAKALHRLRVEFLDWQFREFPMAGADAVRCMAGAGLCTQAEADAAIAEAREKWIASLSEEERPKPFPEDETPFAASGASFDRSELDDEMPF